MPRKFASTALVISLFFLLLTRLSFAMTPTDDQVAQLFSCAQDGDYAQDKRAEGNTVYSELLAEGVSPIIRGDKSLRRNIRIAIVAGDIGKLKELLHDVNINYA